MAKTYYRVLKEDILSKNNKLLNSKNEEVLTSSIHEYDFSNNGKLIPCVVIYSRYWYRVPISVFKEGTAKQFTE